MQMRNRLVLIAVLVTTCLLGTSSFRLSLAQAGDRREDRVNKEAPDKTADSQVGDTAGDSTDPTSSPDALANAGAAVGGHWSGSISDSSLGAGTLDLLINHHNKTKLNGGFDVSFTTSEDFVGSLSGASNKNGVKVTLKPNKQHNCRVTLTPTSVSSSEIKGTYSTSKCSGLTDGNFDVTFDHP